MDGRFDAKVIMQITKKKLTLIIPSLQAGGMERVMTELATFFCQKEELEVYLILYGIKRDIFYEIPENLIIKIPSFEFDNNKRFWHTLKTFWFLRKTIKVIKPDRILSFGELWNNFVLLSTLGLNFPVFVSDRCQPNKSLGKIHDRLRNWLYPKAACVICQTDMAKHIYGKMFNHHNFSVIGNPIRAIQTNYAIPKENIVISVGRLIQTKHHDDLIKIFSDINVPNWKLIIVGDDALKQKNREKLEALIKELKAEDKIILTGKRNDVDNFYIKSKIFAFTSSSEGFPNVIGEAMSAGLPVVAYDCVAGPSDLIENEHTGYLIPLHDRAFFAEKLKLLMLNETLRKNLGTNGKLKVANFSVQKIGKQFEHILFNEDSSN